MALSFGLGNPLGDYAKNETLADHGFAIKGFMADYSGAYYLTDYIGIGGSIKFNQNVLDYEAVKTELLRLLPEDPDTTASLNIGYWSIVSFGIGPQFTLPIGSKLNFDVYAFPGLHIVTSPKLELTAEIEGVPHYYSVTAQNLRLGFEAGASIRIKLGSNTGLRIFASYLQTSSKGEILQKIDDNNNDTNSTTDFSRRCPALSAPDSISEKTAPASTDGS